MSRRARIGELLRAMVPLSGHDVEEILQEQSSNGRKFGEIALAWGLCQPQHVWDAWCQQGDRDGETLDLDKVGIDARAAALLPAETARQLGMIPLRVASDCALIATSDAAPEHATNQLAELLHRRIKFVRATREQIAAMIEMDYPITG